MLSKQLGMSVQEAERWIVDLVREARLDAKIDAEASHVLMVRHPPAAARLFIRRLVPLWRPSLTARTAVDCTPNPPPPPPPPPPPRRRAAMQGVDTPDVYQQVIDKTKGLAQRSYVLAKMLEETSRGGYNAGRYAEPDLDQ